MDLAEREAIGEHVRRHPWERARARFVIHQLHQIGPIEGAILDIGCGDAYVLSQIRKAFPTTPCIGVDTAFCGQIACPEGVEIYASTQAVPAAIRPAGVILLMDVLEHLDDPAQLLTDLRQQGLAGPQTHLFVAVPAHQCLFGQHDQWLGHRRRYNRSLLSQHMREGGVEVRHTSYFFLSLLFMRALEVVLHRLGIQRREATGLVQWRGGEALSQGLSWCLQLDFHFCQRVQSALGLTLPGLSCYGLGRFR
jgi:trans-aconitate methyltransferase